MKLIVPAQPGPVTVDSERTALVVVDMQNAFCKKGGMFDSMGMLVESKMQPVIQIDKKVIGAVRQKGIKIIYLRMGYEPDLSNAGGPESPNYWKEGSLVGMREHPELKGRVLTVNTPEWEIIEELQPHPDDILVNKCRYSGFAHTGFNAVLKDNNLKYLLFSGVFTNVCVESTIRDAYFEEFFPVLISDACTNSGPDYNQQATIWNVTNIFGWVTTSEDLIKSLALLS